MIELNSDKCFICGKDNKIGLHLDINIGKGTAEAVWTAKQEYCGYTDMLHGGIMSAILDDMYQHALEYLDVDLVTAHLEMDYKVTAFIGDTLQFKVFEVERGTGRSIKMCGKIYRDDVLLAEGKGIMVIIDPKKYIREN
jgi:acyl-coenzyme A thioesterase PaaI-like protein